MNLGFLNANAWLDADGYHVWQAHDCANGRPGAGRIVSMLPWPTWRSVADRVEPSLNCSDCGLHVFLRIGQPEASA